MEQAFTIILSLGAASAGFVLFVVGINKRYAERRILREGNVVRGAVIQMWDGVDHDKLVLVEYTFNETRYTREFVHFSAQIGEELELMVNPRDPRVAYLRVTLPGRIRFYSCLVFVGPIAALAGTTSLILLLRMGRWQ